MITTRKLSYGGYKGSRFCKRDMPVAVEFTKTIEELQLDGYMPSSVELSFTAYKRTNGMRWLAAFLRFTPADEYLSLNISDIPYGWKISTVSGFVTFSMFMSFTSRDY